MGDKSRFSNNKNRIWDFTSIRHCGLKRSARQNLKTRGSRPRKWNGGAPRYQSTAIDEALFRVGRRIVIKLALGSVFLVFLHFQISLIQV